MPSFTPPAKKYAEKFQDVIEDSHPPSAPPVQNTWYTPLDIKGGCIIKQLFIYQSNSETDPKNIEWEMTIDGKVYTNTAAFINGIPQWAFLQTSLGENRIAFSAAEGTFGHRVLIDAVETGITYTASHDFKFRYRMTSVPGTNQDLMCYLWHSTVEAV